jgi:predicted DNA-binding transcriptional regulator AlpA
MDHNDTTSKAARRLIRWPEVKKKTGLSRTTIWREVRAGRFRRRSIQAPARVHGSTTRSITLSRSGSQLAIVARSAGAASYRIVDMLRRAPGATCSSPVARALPRRCPAAAESPARSASPT